MARPILRNKSREWLKRYTTAEIIGTATAMLFAGIVYGHTNSYISAAASGILGEGIGFYGYFIANELLSNAAHYEKFAFCKRIRLAAPLVSKNMLVEFAPAEVIDTILIRPFAMYLVPQHIHPYLFGFLIAKISADAFFYVFAISGYEARRRWL